MGKVGRPRKPSLVTPELLEEAVKWIASGGTMLSFCRQPGRPIRQRVTDAIRQSPEWQRRFTEARRDGFDAIAEEALALIDSDPGPGPKGGRDPATVQWLKARADFRLRLLAKWDTARYGDRVQLAGDPNAPLNAMTDADVEAQILRILARAKERQLRGEEPPSRLEVTNGKGERLNGNGNSEVSN